MTHMAKKELISATKKRYLKVDKKEKGKILDEFCANSGLARKYAIKILSAKHDCNKIARIGRKGRKRKYGHDFMIAVIKIWEVLDYPCGQRLKSSLPEMYAALIRFKEINFNEVVSQQLKTVSGKTLDRRLKRERTARCLKRNRGMTCRGSLLKSSIPVRLTNRIHLNWVLRKLTLWLIMAGIQPDYSLTRLIRRRYSAAGPSRKRLWAREKRRCWTL